jgi:hypothetical protein
MKHDQKCCDPRLMMVWVSCASGVMPILEEAEGWSFVVAELQSAGALVAHDSSALAEILVQNEPVDS